MEKSCGDSTNQYLKNLNKLSHKISKPILPTSKKPPFDPHDLHQPPPPHQPPVYNINKNDFRDVVQKLTGSPAHERFSTPPPIQPPKPPSSRLQRIRPPPLAQVSNRPPPLLNSALPLNPAASVSNQLGLRPLAPAPLSPLPPFPSVHAAAESPVSAYMRYLHNSNPIGDSSEEFSGFSPLPPPPHQQPVYSNQHQQPIPPPPPQTSATMTSQLPPSPLPFGCLNSPRSPHPFFSPGLLLSPTAFPVSPTLPVPSPRWRSL
ncbi:VQ motif-containing protein [Euphorbia peplus]|nr:VQ motif-containing protein [Euphorbia peplus]